MIVVLVVLYNSLKLINKKIEDIYVVINGGGFVGFLIIRKFLAVGVKYIIIVDCVGILSEIDIVLLLYYVEIVKLINWEYCIGDLVIVFEGVDVFVGVLVLGVLKFEWI